MTLLNYYVFRILFLMIFKFFNLLNKVDISDYKNVNSVNFRRLPKNNERIYDQKILDKTMVPGLNLRLWPRGSDKARFTVIWVITQKKNEMLLRGLKIFIYKSDEGCNKPHKWQLSFANMHSNLPHVWHTRQIRVGDYWWLAISMQWINIVGLWGDSDTNVVNRVCNI